MAQNNAPTHNDPVRFIQVGTAAEPAAGSNEHLNEVIQFHRKRRVAELIDNAIQGLNNLYRLFVDMGAVEEDDIRWPPHDELAIKRTANIMQTHGYSENAAHIVMRIPWVKVGQRIPLAERVFPVDWYEPHCIEASTYPNTGHMYKESEHAGIFAKIPPHVLTIAMGYEYPCRIVSLDTNTGLIHQWDSDDVWDIGEAVRPADEYFKELINSYQSLKRIPLMVGITRRDCDERLDPSDMDVLGDWLDIGCPVYHRTRAMMLDHGWPDDFQRQDFVRRYDDRLIGHWCRTLFHELNDIEAELGTHHHEPDVTYCGEAFKIQLPRARAAAQREDAYRYSASRLNPAPPMDWDRLGR